MNSDIFSFLIPNLNESIQVVFFILMFGTAFFTIFKVKKSATPENWELKWNGGTLNDTSDDLDAEHGSVTDLSSAVATTWEKLAEAMPGILLILGLLGTFLGLGIALNKASTILSAGVGMDDSMNNLMSMMQGLGTKFKTSTWGIIAFLGLKIWMSYDRFEEIRLRWCIHKVKAELDKNRTIVTQQRIKEHSEFISSIQFLNENLCSTLKSEFSENRISFNTGHELLMQQNEIATQNKAGILGVLASLKLQLEESKILVADTRLTREILTSFVDSNSSNLTAMQASSEQMATAAGRVGESAGELKLAIGDFQSGVADVLATLKKDLGQTIDLMSENFGENMKGMSKNLESATSGISTAVSDLAASVDATMNSVESAIKESMDIQKKAQIEFITTSDTLNVNVSAMAGLVNKLSGDITSGLSAISGSNRNVMSLNSRYEAMTQSAEDTAKSIENLVDEVKREFAKYDTGNAMPNVIKSLHEIEQQLKLIVQKNHENTNLQGG
ncbi:hypothetical protein H8K33_19210 [Undibacterium amnicola]|uniref:MotA/TolQ/ExbB proton channel domain-containing protein n=1 Tax=Undibacterium amnicola TaxID=1834038 RepID=A0ABR6XW02_9BURK|nr:hypothetical protein [Undibacterium amnicola]MBC3833644.1 hypothetical protein [Undibacterium amnicola]